MKEREIQEREKRILLEMKPPKNDKDKQPRPIGESLL